MLRLSPVIVIVMLLAPGCRNAPTEQVDHQNDWREVLRHKQAAMATGASPQVRQLYADSVRAFVQKHPTHSRGRDVWHRIQLEFADDLSAIGRYRDAIRFYRAVLERDPVNEPARRGLVAAADRLEISRDKLLTLQKGMSKREVAAILGKPIPGWTERNARRESTVEAWYYRTRQGAVAGVYFRDGRVFAAEENSSARTARLTS